MARPRVRQRGARATGATRGRPTTRERTANTAAAVIPISEISAAPGSKSSKAMPKRAKVMPKRDGLTPSLGNPVRPAPKFAQPGQVSAQPEPALGTVVQKDVVALDSDGAVRGDDNATGGNGSTARSLDMPVVLQCGDCHRVLADTVGFTAACAERGTVSVMAARGVVVSKQLKMADSEFDNGCAYRSLSCEHCNGPLGKMYTTTAGELDRLREAYTFDSERLVSYELASCFTFQGKAIGASDLTHFERLASTGMNPHGLGNMNGYVDKESFDDLDRHVVTLTEATNRLTAGFQDMREELMKNETILIAWDERFQDIRTMGTRLADVENFLTRQGFGSLAPTPLYGNDARGAAAIANGQPPAVYQPTLLQQPGASHAGEDAARDRITPNTAPANKRRRGA